MKFRLIMNPGSRSGRGRKLWAAWETGLRSAGADFDCVVTEKPGQAIEIARAAQGVDAVVAVGGDGTINEVLDGLMQNPDKHLRMGVLYSGTSPDFCRFHRIPTEPGAALAALLGGRHRAVDVVQISHLDPASRPVISHFACSCNIGLGAEIAGVSNLLRRHVGDMPGTGIAALRAILLCRKNDLECELDGERFSLADVNNVSIIKNPFIASGLKLNIGVQPDDGRLFFVCVKGKGRLGLLGTLPGFYTGKACSFPEIMVRQCCTGRISASRHQEIEFDGDPRGLLPMEFRIVPQGLKLIGGPSE